MSSAPIDEELVAAFRSWWATVPDSQIPVKHFHGIVHPNGFGADPNCSGCIDVDWVR